MTVMARHATGSGSGTVVLDRRPGYIAFKLVNFDIDDAHLKPGHVDFITREILPFLRSPGFHRARLTGLASRSGDFTYNLALGQRRADGVETFLFTQLTKEFKALRIDTESAGFAQAFGKSDADGMDDRAVLVEVLLSPAPPAPSPVRIPPPPPNLREPDYLKKGSAGNDIPMFQVPRGFKLIQTNQDNRLVFSAGQIVDCVVSGAGVAHVTISESKDKRTIIPSAFGSSEEFDKFGKIPLGWNFDFKFSSEFASKSGTASVICFSDWVKGIPDPSQPKPR